MDGELHLTQSALKRQPKSYLTWLHRRWIVARSIRKIGASPAVDGEATATAGEGDRARSLAILERELALCSQFLELDHRNFHCHNYRRWVAAWLKQSAEADLAFTDALISRNPSNFSAWHQRSQSLTRLHGETGRIDLAT